MVLYINFQLLENKRKEQSVSRRRQWLMTSLTGPSRTTFLCALLAYYERYCFIQVTCKLQHERERPDMERKYM